MLVGDSECHYDKVPLLLETPRMGFRNFLPHEEWAFLCNSFPLLSFWLSVGQGQLKLPWLSGVLTVTTALCLWYMDWCRHTNSGFYGAVEASQSSQHGLPGHGPWRTSAPGVYSPKMPKENISLEHLPSLWSPHAPHFHCQLLFPPQWRAVLGGLVFSCESMSAIPGIRDKVGQQFSRLLPSGNTVSFRVRGKENKCGK